MWCLQVAVNKRGRQRGVYLREWDETNQVQYLTAQIIPTFMGEKDPENPQYNRAKFDYDARVALISTESWIATPDFLYIHSGGKVNLIQWLGWKTNITFVQRQRIPNQGGSYCA